MASRRTVTYIVIALILGAALALAVALARGGDLRGGDGGDGGPVVAVQQGGVLGDDQGAADVSSADPAKQEPLLDTFTSKDPFIPLIVTGGGGGGGGGGGAGGDTTTYSARVKVDGSSYTVTNGDKVPTGAAAFSISSVTSGDVTFAVIGGSLENGDSSVTVYLGEAVRVTLDNGDRYELAVTSIGSGGGGGGGAQGHTISVLSVSSSNGTALATIEVDGKTYADKTVGEVISTSWGQIEILAINVGAQTVTVLHGDQTIVLRAGQVVVK